MRTILAISENYWGKGDTIEVAMKQLRKAGGTIAKGKMLLKSAPAGAYVDDMGYICFETPNGEERPYYIDRNGNRLPEDVKPLV